MSGGRDFGPQHAHVPRKRFGQHFLHDQGILRRIVDAIAPQPGDRLVEIGPGEGALTLPLLREAGRLTVIELDRDLIEPLRARAAAIGELTIVHRDVLSVDFSALAREIGSGPLRLVGNLPYKPYGAALLKGPAPFPESGELRKPWTFKGKTYMP